MSYLLCTHKRRNVCHPKACLCNTVSHNLQQGVTRLQKHHVQLSGALMKALRNTANEGVEECLQGSGCLCVMEMVEGGGWDGKKREETQSEEAQEEYQTACVLCAHMKDRVQQLRMPAIQHRLA